MFKSFETHSRVKITIKENMFNFQESLREFFYNHKAHTMYEGCS